MIIIAGAGHTHKDTFLMNEKKHCFYCNNTNNWLLQKTKYFITLFFLPVAPYKTSYELLCPICGNSVKLDRETYDKMKQVSKPYK
jgi:hypothetical protein